MAKFQFTVRNMLLGTAWFAASCGAWSWMLAGHRRLDHLATPYLVIWMFFATVAPSIAIDVFFGRHRWSWLRIVMFVLLGGMFAGILDG